MDTYFCFIYYMFDPLPQETGSFKGRALFDKADQDCHVWCKIEPSYTCRIAVNFGTLKDYSL